MSNIISWFEIPARNFEETLTFYSKVFTIQIDIFDFNGVRHGVFRIENEITGAIVETPEMSQKNLGPTLFFNANPDMLEIIDNIKQCGGEIILPKTLIKNERSEDGTAEIPNTLIDNNVGYFAYFYDPEGNKMGLYANS